VGELRGGWLARPLPGGQQEASHHQEHPAIAGALGVHRTLGQLHLVAVQIQPTDVLFDRIDALHQLPALLPHFPVREGGVLLVEAVELVGALGEHAVVVGHEAVGHGGGRGPLSRRHAAAGVLVLVLLVNLDSGNCR